MTWPPPGWYVFSYPQVSQKTDPSQMRSWQVILTHSWIGSPPRGPTCIFEIISFYGFQQLTQSSGELSFWEFYWIRIFISPKIIFLVLFFIRNLNHSPSGLPLFNKESTGVGVRYLVSVYFLWVLLPRDLFWYLFYMMNKQFSTSQYWDHLNRVLLFTIQLLYIL